jgi:release factor glutamine methyltransferase
MLLTVREALQRASTYLKEQGVKDYRFAAELLLRHLLSWDRTAFFLNLDQKAVDWQRLDPLLQQVAQGVPLQYITGEQEFYGLVFSMNKHVLIPRPETEILVEHVLLRLPNEPYTVADLGTGSGAIAVALAVHRPKWRILAVDLSLPALQIAKTNAQQNKVNNVEFVHEDMLSFLDRTEPLDAIVSNPPYIPKEEINTLDRHVQNEPHLALDGGEDGLYFYREIARRIPRALKRGGLAAFEVGFGQARDVMAMFYRFQIDVVKDLAGIERVVFIRDPR